MADLTQQQKNTAVLDIFEPSEVSETIPDTTIQTASSGNVYDQFDTPTAAPAPSGNIYDQFDETGNVYDQFDKERSFGEKAGTVGASLTDAAMSILESGLRLPGAADRMMQASPKYGHTGPIGDGMDWMFSKAADGTNYLADLVAGSKEQLRNPENPMVPDSVAAAFQRVDEKGANVDTATDMTGIPDAAHKTLRPIWDAITNLDPSELAKSDYSGALKSLVNGDYSGIGEVLTDPETLLSAGAQAAPSLTVAKMAGVPGMFGLEGGGAASDIAQFEKQAGRKLTPAEFTQAFMQTAVINTILEKIGADASFGKGVKGRLLAVANAAYKEGGTEAVQQINSNLAKLAYDPNAKISEGVLMSAIGGAGTGAVANLFTGGSESVAPPPTPAPPPPEEPLVSPAAPATTSEPPSTPPAAPAQENDIVRDAMSRLQSEALPQVDLPQMATPEAAAAWPFKEKPAEPALVTPEPTGIDQAAAAELQAELKQEKLPPAPDSLDTLRTMALKTLEPSEDTDEDEIKPVDVKATEKAAMEMLKRMDAEGIGYDPERKAIQSVEAEVERNIDEKLFKLASGGVNASSNLLDTTTNRNTSVSEPTLNGVVTDSEMFGDESDAKTIRVKGFNDLDRDRQHMVLSHMRTALNNHKVFDSVIKAIPIDVMYDLTGKKFSSKELLHNPSMLTHRLSVPSDVAIPKFVSRFIDSLSSKITPVSANLGAEESGLLGASGSVDNNDPTVSTNGMNRSHGHVIKTSVAGKSVEINISPTDSQKQAGNYKKGSISIQGLPISIENPAGSERSGTGADGSTWSVKMPVSYGYIKKTKGADGDHVDAFIGNNPKSDTVFVINQKNTEDDSFDETKSMIGFDSMKEATDAYANSFSDGRGYERIMDKPVQMSMQEFKSWIDKPSNQKKPVMNLKREAPVTSTPKEVILDGKGKQEGQGRQGLLTEQTAAPNPVAADSADAVPKNPWEMTKEEFDGDVIYQGVHPHTDENSPSRWHSTSSKDAVKFATAPSDRPSKTKARVDISRKSSLPKESHTIEETDGMEGTHYYTGGLESHAQKIASVPVDQAENAHKYLVEQALKEGKSVPDSVLKQYPDLKKKYAKNPVDNLPVIESLTPDNATQAMADAEKLHDATKDEPARAALKDYMDKAGEVSAAEPEAKQAAYPAVDEKLANMKPEYAETRLKSLDKKLTAGLALKPAEMYERERLSEKVKAEKGTQKSDGYSEFDHSNHLIYPITVGGTQKWAVQTPDNKKSGKVLGDTIHTTKEEAMAEAERSDKREAESQKRAEEKKVQDDAAAKKKEENKSKSLSQRRSDSYLEKPHNFSDKYGFKGATKKDAVEEAVERGLRFEKKMVFAPAAKSNDQDIVSNARKSGYIVGLSNENIPAVKAAMEAAERLKNDRNYDKEEYRLWREDGEVFRNISKTEYDYAQSLLTSQAKDAKIEPESKTEDKSDEQEKKETTADILPVENDGAIPNVGIYSKGTKTSPRGVRTFRGVRLARRIRSEGGFEPEIGRLGRCYALASDFAQQSGGHLLIGTVKDGNGNRIYHAVVETHDMGETMIYDPVMDVAFSPEVFDDLAGGWIKGASLSTEEIREFLRKYNKYPNPEQLRLPAAARLKEDDTSQGNLFSLGSLVKTSTDAFKKWFGKSKVVDANGKPMTMYHGTQSEFENFDLSKGRATDSGYIGRGFYFTPEKGLASLYAGRKGWGGNVRPVYLSIQNPLTKISKEMEARIEKRAEELLVKQNVPKGESWTDIDAFSPEQRQEQARSEAITEVAKEDGYDGIIMPNPKNPLPDGTPEYVAFSPEQIRSVFEEYADFEPTAEFTEKLDNIKQKVLAAAQRMNPEVKVKFVDRLFGSGQDVVRSGATGPDAIEAAGVYRVTQKLVEVSLNLDKFDPQESAFHELWHSLEDLLSPEEVRLLRRDFPETKTDAGGTVAAYEHAAYSAAEYMRGKMGNTSPAARRIFSKIRNFLRAIGNALRGYGFRTVEDIFDKAYSGALYQERIASKPNLASNKDVEAMEPNPNDMFGGGQNGNFGASGIEALADRAAHYIEEGKADEALEYALGSLKDFVKKRKDAPELDTGIDLSYFRNALVHPRTIAKKFREFTPVWRAAETQYEIRDRIATEMGMITEPYFALPDKSNVDKAMEIGRLEGKVISPNDDSIVNMSGNASLTKKGERVKLNPAELKAYRAVRHGLDTAMKNMHSMAMFKAGINPNAAGAPQNSKDVEAMARQEVDRNRKEVLETLAITLKSIEEARMRGYVPFTRFGNYAVVVKDRDGHVVNRTHFEIGALKRLSGAGKVEIEEKRQELMKKYPSYDGYTVSDHILLNSREAMLKAKVDLNSLDALASATGNNNDYYQGFRDDIEKEQKKYGFTSHMMRANNTPGYSTDFERVLSEYMYKFSNYVARQSTAPMFENAIKNIDAVKLHRLRKYAEDFKNYLNEPREEYQRLRNTVFMLYLAANPSSAAVNLTQVEVMTAPYLGQYVNPAVVAKEIAAAYKDTMLMLNKSADGVKFDMERAPEDVRAALVDANARGDLVPQMSIEQMSIASGRQRLFRNQRKIVGKVGKIFYEIYSSAERVNRIVTYIASHRIAQMKGVKEAAEKVHSNDNVWKSQTGDFADKLARWVIDETHFKVGKINRPRLFRGAGAALLQFKGYTLMGLELYKELLDTSLKSKDATVRKAGRTALALAMAMLMTFAGLWGLPFAEDIKDATEFLYKQATAIDLDIDKEIREFSSEVLQDTGVSKDGADMAAMMFVRGLARSSGIDVSQRTSMGNILPDITGKDAAKDILGMPYDLTVGRTTRALEAYKNGAPWYDIAKEYTPALIQNAVTAYSWANNGVTSNGDTLIPADDVSRETVLLKALGFTSSEVSGAREYFYMAKRATQKVSDLQSRYYTRLSRAIVQGDAEKAASIQSEIRDFNAGKPLADSIILNPSYLKREINKQRLGIKSFRPSKKSASEFQNIMEMNPYKPHPDPAVQDLIDNTGPLNARNKAAYQRILDQDDDDAQ